MAVCALSALHGWLDGDDAAVLGVVVLGAGVELATLAVWVVGAAVLRSGDCQEAGSCSGRAAGTVRAQNVAALGSGRESGMHGLLGYFVCEIHTVLLLPVQDSIHPSCFSSPWRGRTRGNDHNVSAQSLIRQSLPVRRGCPT